MLWKDELVRLKGKLITFSDLLSNNLTASSKFYVIKSAFATMKNKIWNTVFLHKHGAGFTSFTRPCNTSR